MNEPANVDAIYKGQAFGGVAGRLMAHGMNTKALRTADTLRKDEWKELDQAVTDISRVRLVGVNDLLTRGLVYRLNNALGTTVLETETVSDLNDAQLDMAADAVMAKDQLKFDIGYLPLPIVHKDFQLSARRLASSRTLGQSLDVSTAQAAAVKVAEKIETILFQGASTYTFGGGTLYGYQDHPNRNTVTLAQNWDASAGNGELILADVMSMKQASINAKHYGPWILYIPTAWERTLDEDFKSGSDLSVRQRLLMIDGLQAIRVADKLSANNAVLVELNPMTVRMVVGMEPTTVEWQAMGGMLFEFKVMSIMVPQIRADNDGNTGVVHLAA